MGRREGPRLRQERLEVVLVDVACVEDERIAENDDAAVSDFPRTEPADLENVALGPGRLAGDVVMQRVGREIAEIDKVPKEEALHA